MKHWRHLVLILAVLISTSTPVLAFHGDTRVQASTAPAADLAFDYYPIDGTLPAGLSGAVVDFDGDGDLDVLGASSSSQTWYQGVFWYENVLPNNWIEHTIATDSQYRAVEGGDLDGDGDVDVAAYRAADGAAGWLENQGGSFAWHTLVASSAGYRELLRVVDLNQDLNLDVLVAVSAGLLWFENDGGGTFTEHAIQTDLFDVVVAADLDGDLDLDVAAGVATDSNGGGFLVAWENDGSQHFSQHVIWDSGTPNNVGPNDLVAADVDGDGDVDLVTVHGGSALVSWWENEGEFTLVRRDVLTSTTYLFNVDAADFDRDLDTDLVIGYRYPGSQHQSVRWLENDGDERFTIRPVMTSYSSIMDLETADLDSNSWPDIVAVDWDPLGVIWFENRGLVPDLLPPAAITDLSLMAGSFPGDVILHWTATGDDGAVGQATRYEVRWDVTPILTEDDWANSALPVDGPYPAPAAAGTAQEMTAHFAPGVTLYFAVKACDEDGNWSEVSTSPSLTMPGHLISDVNDALETDPTSILGEEVTVVGVVARTDDWTGGLGDVVRTHEGLIKLFDTIKGLAEIGWALVDHGGWAALKVLLEGTMSGQMTDDWMSMRAAMIVGTEAGEGGDPTLLVWDPQGALPEAGYPFTITGVITEQTFLWFGIRDSFYYLDVTDAGDMVKVIPSSDDAHFPIPAGYAFKNSMDIGTGIVNGGEQVCGIGIVNERYEKGGYGYLQLTLMQRALSGGDPPMLARVAAGEPQPELGALVMACGTKDIGWVGWHWWEFEGFLDTTVDDGSLTRLRGHLEEIAGHEMVGRAGLFIHAGSPVDLHLTDPQGRHVGPLYDGDGNAMGVEEGIPGAFYIYGAGEAPESVWLPNPLGGPYTLLVEGQALGTYTQTVEVLDPGGRATYSDVRVGRPTLPGSVDMTILDQIPAAPGDLRRTVVGLTVSLDWADNAEPDLAGYRVYRQRMADGLIVLLTPDDVPTSQYTDTLPDRQAYRYWVTALDTMHNESGHASTVPGLVYISLPVTLRRWP